MRNAWTNNCFSHSYSNILTVEAPILNKFGFWMFDGVPFFDGVLFLHGRPFCHKKWQPSYFWNGSHALTLLFPECILKFLINNNPKTLSAILCNNFIACLCSAIAGSERAKSEPFEIRLLKRSNFKWGSNLSVPI